MKAFEYGDVLVTLGTGKISEFEQVSAGLVGEHDYAVINLQEKSEKRMVLVKNPWSEGSGWTRNDGLGDGCDLPDRNGHSAAPAQAGSGELEGKRPVQEPGTFWMNVNDVFQHFEILYLNWNPGLFPQRQDIHFSWDLARTNGLWASFMNNPQFQIRSKAAGTVWLVLSRHFKSSAGASNSADNESFRASAVHTGFISLYLFCGRGEKVALADGFAVRGSYVDSPNTLLRVEVLQNVPYTVVVSEQTLPRSSHSFTLSAFSLQPLSITEAPDKYPNRTAIVDAWTPATAGGNASHPSYARNPQFKLQLPHPSDVSLLVELHREDFPVHVKLIWSDGNPIRFVGARDIVGDSGEYRKGHAFAEVLKVPAGRYTIVCSTFEQGQLGKFTLQIGTTSRSTVDRLHTRRAGQFVTRPEMATFVGETDSLWAPLKCSRLTRVCIAAHSHATERGTSSQIDSGGLPLKLSVESRQGLMKRVLAISGNDEFTNGHYGVEVDDVDVEPSMCTEAGVRIVLERAGPLYLNGQESVEVEVYSDAGVQIGSWHGPP